MNQGTHKAIDVNHPTDMNFHLSYSAVMKYQDNFKFNYNTFALKIFTKFIEFTI